MESQLRGSLTFRPHWWTQHIFPSFHSNHPASGIDIDSASYRASRRGKDPLGLLSGYKEPEKWYLHGAATPGPASARHAWWQRAILCLSACSPATIRVRRRQARVARFYQAQNAAIGRLLASVDEHRAVAAAMAKAEAGRVRVAVYGSLAANVALSGVQLFAAISSGSLSLFATMTDAVFDPLSNVMLVAANRAARRVDARRFPSGRSRLETAGNIVFCFLMVAVSIVIIAFSARELSVRSADTLAGGLNRFHVPAVIGATTSFAIKFALFLFCFPLRNHYSQVRIVWQDHRNDVFINAFGVLTSVGGSKVAWWIDPAGAIVLSLAIIVLWCRTAIAEFMLVVGIAASTETQQLITYICLTHSPAIKGLDTVRVYHSGPRLIAEVDVVMDRDATLEFIHDISEGLQYKLESLPGVERAYVHVDYETTHVPEHGYVTKDTRQAETL